LLFVGIDFRDLPPGGGHSGELLRRIDWSASPVGPPSGWAQPLKTLLNVVMGSNQPMFVAWGEAGTLFYNDAYSEILAAKHPAAFGQPFLQVWAEIAADLVPIVRKAYAGEPVHMNDIELHLERRGFREEAHFAFSYTPIRDDTGTIGGFFCACMETTGQVLADRRALQQHERYRRLFKQAPGFITILQQPNHVFEFVNDAYVKLFGDRNYVGKTVREVFPELEGQGFFEWLDEVYATGERHFAHGVPARLRLGPDGPEVERILDFIYEPVVDELGRVTGIFCEGHDTTDTYLAQAALRENEARLKELNATLEQRVSQAVAERQVLADVVESTDAFVQVVGLDYRWMAINKAAADEFEALFGLRPKPGDTMLELLADQPAHLEAVRQVWDRALAGEAFTAIDEFGDQNRARRFYEMKFNILRDPDGRRIGAYQFVYDVTERLRRESELALAQDALRQSQKMDAMGQLTGGVAHDFNNLLMPIIGSLDMLQRKDVGDVRAQRMIDGALQAADRAKTLVQRLLAFARRQPLQAHPVDLVALINGMQDLLASTVGPRIRIVLDLQPDLPAALGDTNQLEMALLNLAVNSRDAMPDGGALTIVAALENVQSEHGSALRPGAYLRLCVNDTGVGMDEATRRQATDPFFSTKGVGKGTGLGLSMVHGLAAQLGGALALESEPGCGATIKIWLPVADGNAAASVRRTDPVLGPHSGTVLLVDDEDLVRASTADMLSDLGYRVVEAQSAEDALRTIDDELQVSLLVTDHLMPGMTGEDLARAMGRKRPDLPVLLISGYAEAEGVGREFARLTKPFRQAELAATLMELSRKRHP
jgi:signal transduction histidine kinase/CheY-like chemotaxis protein